MTDKRFSSGKSVHNLGHFARRCAFRSRPASSTDKGGDEVIGVIYIDSSVKNYTYAPDQLRLLTAIGMQAGPGDPERQALSGGRASRAPGRRGRNGPPPFRIQSKTSCKRFAAARMSSRMGLARQQSRAGVKGLAHRRFATSTRSTTSR